MNTHDRTHCAPKALRSDNYRESDQKLGRVRLHSSVQPRGASLATKYTLIEHEVSGANPVWQPHPIRHLLHSSEGAMPPAPSPTQTALTKPAHPHLAKSRDAPARAQRSAVTSSYENTDSRRLSERRALRARSEFCRVPPHSSALLVTFRAPAKSYSPAGANTRHPHSTT